MNDQQHDMFFRFEISAFKQANPQLLLGYTDPGWQPDGKAGFAGLAD